MSRERIDDALWLRQLREAVPVRVAIVGGSGRLGSWFARILTDNGHRVRVLDAHPPLPLPGQEYLHCDLSAPGPLPAAAFAVCDSVVHLAALHGAHLVAGTPRRAFWPVNVNGTDLVLRAARSAGVRRVVVASSTSVHGSGSASGPARILREDTALDPEDVYDMTKIAAERLVRQAVATGLDAVALRFGRFFFPSHTEYHLRKLSTGLDVRDCCQAIVRVLFAPAVPQRVYVVASDLPLTEPQRADLGVDPIKVLQGAVPELLEAARRRGIPIPARIGKSVCSDALRADLGYRPERALDWVAQVWSEPSAAELIPAVTRLPRPVAQLQEDPYPC